MNETKARKELRKLEKYNKSPIGYVDRKLKKAVKFADDNLFKKIDIPELMSHPHV